MNFGADTATGSGIVINHFLVWDSADRSPPYSQKKKPRVSVRNAGPKSSHLLRRLYVRLQLQNATHRTVFHIRAFPTQWTGPHDRPGRSSGKLTVAKLMSWCNLKLSDGREVLL